jgi:hypothetical protein
MLGYLVIETTDKVVFYIIRIYFKCFFLRFLKSLREVKHLFQSIILFSVE